MSMDKMPESLPKPLLKDIVSKLEKQNKKIKEKDEAAISKKLLPTKENLSRRVIYG